MALSTFDMGWRVLGRFWHCLLQCGYTPDLWSHLRFWLTAVHLWQPQLARPWHILNSPFTLLVFYSLGGGEEVSQNSVSSPFSHNSSGTIRSTHLLTLEQRLPKRPDSFRPSSKALIPLVSFKKKIKTSLVPQGSLLYHTGSCLNLQINQLNPPTPALAVHGLVWDKVWKHRLTERC